MAQLNLHFFDLENFVSNFNKHLAREEGLLLLETPVRKRPRKNPFLYCADKFADTKRDSPYKILLMQEYTNCFRLDSEEQIGYIFAETGDLNANDSEPEIYEALRIRIKNPLKLQTGVIVPSCSVKLYRASSYAPDNPPERRDHVRRFMHWQRTDLGQMLPTEWFLKQA